MPRRASKDGIWGGRPPYGYRLADAGPHPNRMLATWGRRLHKLERDPDTAPHVRWMFTQRQAGRSLAGIARTLNDDQVPYPAGADPERNRHRKGDAWTIQSLAAILANPRYTGWQVWNRQRTDRDPTSPDGVFGQPGHDEIQRWNGVRGNTADVRSLSTAERWRRVVHRRHEQAPWPPAGRRCQRLRGTTRPDS